MPTLLNYQAFIGLKIPLATLLNTSLLSEAKKTIWLIFSDETGRNSEVSAVFMTAFAVSRTALNFTIQCGVSTTRWDDGTGGTLENETCEFLIFGHAEMGVHSKYYE